MAINQHCEAIQEETSCISGHDLRTLGIETAYFRKKKTAGIAKAIR